MLQGTKAEGDLCCATRNKQQLYAFKCLICKHKETGPWYSNGCSNKGELKPATGEDTEHLVLQCKTYFSD